VTTGLHEDRTPSLQAYPDGSWACFGCGKGGTIYDFAGYVFGVQTKGRAFLELRERLAEMFGVEDPLRHRGVRRPRPPAAQPSRVVLGRAGVERGIER
jgi:DNA primase